MIVTFFEFCCQQDIQENEDDPENPMVKSYDVRPGNVNVYLPYIEFAEDVLADFIEKYQEKPSLHRKVKNILSQIVNTFRSISVITISENNHYNFVFVSNNVCFCRNYVERCRIPLWSKKKRPKSK